MPHGDRFLALAGEFRDVSLHRLVQFHFSPFNQHHYRRCARHHFRQRRQVKNRVLSHVFDFWLQRPMSKSLPIFAFAVLNPQNSARTFFFFNRQIDFFVHFVQDFGIQRRLRPGCSRKADRNQKPRCRQRQSVAVDKEDPGPQRYRREALPDASGDLY